ncbi:alpha/beta fold hydrolase [Streptomyces avermitilis]
MTDPIVVLCGVHQDISSYRRYDRYWRDSATLVYVDLPGGPLTSPVPLSSGYEVHTDALAHLVDTLELPRINLIGISGGYLTAYRYAQRWPSRVSHLILTGAGEWEPVALTKTVESVRLLRADQVDEYARESIETFLCQDQERTVRSREVIRRALYARLSSVDPGQIDAHTDVLDRILLHPSAPPGGIRGVRTLCVAGEHDTVTGPARVRALAAQIEGALVTSIRETDHLCFLERAPEWAETVLRFVTDRTLDDLEHLTPVECPSGAVAL